MACLFTQKGLRSGVGELLNTHMLDGMALLRAGKQGGSQRAAGSCSVFIELGRGESFGKVPALRSPDLQVPSETHGGLKKGDLRPVPQHFLQTAEHPLWPPSASLTLTTAACSFFFFFPLYLSFPQSPPSSRSLRPEHLESPSAGLPQILRRAVLIGCPKFQSPPPP